MTKNKLSLTFLSKYKDAGLLLLRLGVGLDMLVLHGWGKITGGAELWIRLGKNMPGFGVDEIYLFWGLMAALTESVGGLMFALGYKFRHVAFLLGFTMCVAVYAHLSGGDGWGRTSHSLKMVFVFFGMMMIGAGKYKLDKN